MPISFPTNPADSDTHVIGSITYQYNATDDKWTGLGISPSDRLIEGSNSLEIDASNNLIWTGNNVGIGTDDPRYSLDVHGGNLLVSGSTAGNLILEDRSVADESRPFAVLASNDGNFTITNSNRNASGTTTSSSEKLRIDSDGRLLVGTSEASNDFRGNNQTPQVQLEGTNLNTSCSSIVRSSADEFGPIFCLAKSRSTSVGGNRALVSDGDSLGQISFEGGNSVDFICSASIEAFLDNTPGAIDMPGRLVFSTTADGAFTPTERLRITSDGKVGVGAENPQATLQIGAGFDSGNPQRHGTLLISADAGFHNFIRFTNGGATETHYPSGIWYQPAGRMELRAALNSSSSNEAQLVLASNGTVGVGIESPTGDFEVNGNDGINISNTTRTGTNGAQWRLIPSSGGSNTNAATNLRLYEGAGATEVLNIQKAGQVMLGHNELISHPNMDDLQIGDANGNRGLTICSGSSGFGSVCFGDSSDGSGNDRYRGFVEYYHGDDSLRLGTESVERFRIVKTTASVASIGTGVNGCGVVGINETDPAGDALALAVHAPYGMDDPRPLVYMKRSHGIGGGNGTDETVLHIDGTASYNSAGVVYGIKVNTKHNLNGSHYSGHFVNDGSQFAANGTSAVYVETHKKDTNGAGELIALHVNGRITTTIANTGYSTAGFFQTGNNVNGRPIVCLQEYTANTWTHQIEFRKNNGSGIVSVGSIKSNNTNTQYNTNSDYRLKENVVSITGAIDRLKQLQPKRFNFIGDGETIDGFIAHEVSSIAPYAVSGEKDAMKTELVMDEDGKEQFDEDGEIISKEVIDPQGVDYGKLSALTIAALQEALVEIETLRGRLDAAGL